MSAILAPGDNCWAIDATGHSGLLIDARDYYREFFRAAKRAEKFIAIAGWQFDREVCLLRGEEATLADEDVRFLPFLDGLCKANPELNIYLLAWDFSLLYAIEREWMQRLIFNLTTSDRLKFRFDTHSSVMGSHHQKVAIIDGTLAFTGGMDICRSRWDDRNHLPENAYRDEGSKAHGPYHDVQAFVTGAAAQRLTSLFEQRWEKAGHGELHLPVSNKPPARVRATLPLPRTPVAFSRTRCQTDCVTGVREIRSLYRRAIASANRLIYLENQYFTSRAVHDALVARMEEARRPKLEIVLVRLRTHDVAITLDDFPVIKAVSPEGLPLDPENPEEVFEVLAKGPEGGFSRGIRELITWVVKPSVADAQSAQRGQATLASKGTG
jgi:phosphatidylserine/phosphatidylglycerophosphate/cardiolipin synthase-like enzyme